MSWFKNSWGISNRHPADLILDSLSQRVGCDDLDIRAMFENVHQQLSVIGVGDFQQIAPVWLNLAILLRMPLLGSNPPGTLRGEPELCPFDLAARENAVAAFQHFLEFALGNV